MNRFTLRSLIVTASALSAVAATVTPDVDSLTDLKMQMGKH